MKRMLTAVALAIFVAPASIGAAVAQEDHYGSADARYHSNPSEPAIADHGPLQWPGAAPRSKTYAWPDQRYYGAHGLLSD